MAVVSRPIYIPEGITGDRVLLGLLESIRQRVDTPRVESVEDLTQTISDPPTQAEVQAVQDKVNELLEALRVAIILDPPAPSP